MRSFAPPFTDPLAIESSLLQRGFAVLSPSVALSLAGAISLDGLSSSWNDLPPDPYLRDGGHYRFRRHSSFVVKNGSSVERVAHRAHYQPVEYNALHGGFDRWFVPMADAVATSEEFLGILRSFARVFGALRPVSTWFVEAHQFRIDTTGGIGRPTPEGAHRDGVDFVVVSLVDRRDIKGGETRVFDSDGPDGVRFTMTEPWTTLLIDDARVIHESTPIQPLSSGGHRDTLVLTFRSGGFQGAVDATLAPASR